MKTAKEIKTQAATVKCTVTAIRNIIEINKYYKRVESDHLVLSDKDIEQLERSASILSKLTAKTGVRGCFPVRIRPFHRIRRPIRSRSRHIGWISSNSGHTVFMRGYADHTS